MEQPNLLRRWLELLDALCSTCLSMQEAQCPESFQGRGVVIPESQVSLALSGQIPVQPQLGFSEALGTLVAAEKDDPEDRLAQLLTRVADSDLARLAIVAALAPEVDRKYERVFGYLQDSITLRRATVGLLADLYSLCAPMSDAELFSLCASGRPLTRFVLEPDEDAERLGRPLILRRAALLYLTGATHLPQPLDELGVLTLPESSVVPLAHHELAEQCARFAIWQGKEAATGLLELYGTPGSGRRFLLQYAAHKAGRALLTLDCTKLVRLSTNQRCDAIEAAAAYCYLNNAIPALHQFTFTNLPPDQRESMAQSLVEGFWGAVSLVTVAGVQPIELQPNPDAHSLRIKIPSCTIGEQRDFWSDFAAHSPLPLESGLEAHDLAGIYTLTPGQIQRTLSLARAEAAARGGTVIRREDVSLGVRTLCAPKLAELTQPLSGSFSWDDLMLEQEQIDRLHWVCDRFRYRFQVNEVWGFDRKLPYGRGVSVLLYGPPGTGKTMTAQVLAREFGLDAFRVDMSRIMDKYIGETEKKLAELFDAAKDANAILFFDEADALFARRTEISDSKDRYANAETAYLLQRMEEHNGISILATNVAQNFDAAFKRRISYMVHLPMPGIELRRRLWQSVFPPEAPIKGVDLDFFAQRFDLSGSSIKSVALSASFLAAAEGGSIMREHIMQAIKEEYLKAGRVIMEHELY